MERPIHTICYLSLYTNSKAGWTFYSGPYSSTGSLHVTKLEIWDLELFERPIDTECDIEPCMTKLYTIRFLKMSNKDQLVQVK